MHKRYWIIVVMLFTIIPGAVAQPASNDTAIDRVLQDIEDHKPAIDFGPNKKGVITEAEYRKLQEDHRWSLLLGILAVTPILILIVLLFIKGTSNYASENIVNATGLILVIQGTLFMSVYATASENLTAPIGILGAIAGYLFGQTRKSTSTTSKDGTT